MNSGITNIETENQIDTTSRIEKKSNNGSMIEPIPHEIETFTDGFMNTSGAIMMSQHFCEKYHDKNQGYSVNSPIWRVAGNPMDVDVICELYKQEHMFCIQILAQKKHWIPVMICHDKAYIFDSVANSNTRASTSEVMMLLKKRGLKIFFSNDQRQSDLLSCGTDSCTVINKCFQYEQQIKNWIEEQSDTEYDTEAFGSEVFKFGILSNEYKAHCSDPKDKRVEFRTFPTPPEIQKYVQSVGLFENYKFKNAELYAGRKLKNPNKIRDYVKQHTVTTDDGRLRNTAMSKRYHKYKKIASLMLD